MSERCETCRFWHVYGNLGACRRYPPTPISEGVQTGNRLVLDWNKSVFPAIGEDGWCGEYRLGARIEIVKTEEPA